ncbi:unnamed protein product [Linum tenue]|uniref:RNase H type-1 domain-containing protein n=1 Tax=Linum tenue TaxID=586396 RepID=A0AAV0NGA9_9ROSI|nr:unnamed protein product [Linum tenue]
MGVCSITPAELKGAAEGLELAWHKGCRKVELNLDSSSAVALIKNRKDTNHIYGLLVKHIDSILDREWDVRISHVYTESNCAADFFANRGHLFPFGTHLLDECDPNLLYWLSYDTMETTMDCDIPNMS